MTYFASELPYAGNARQRRPAAQPLVKFLDCRSSSVGDNLDGPIRQISGNAPNAKTFRLDACAVTEVHALYLSGNEKTARYLSHESHRIDASRRR
jgi:hypothetical protein